VIRLAVRVRPQQAEIVLAELLEIAPSGLEEVRTQDGAVEFAIYGPPGEIPSLPALEAAAGDALVEVTTTEIADDWPTRWRQFHRPILIRAPAPLSRAAQLGREGERGPAQALRIRPPWEAPSARHAGGVEDIVIDPGQAFGTGAHASTQLCLQLLLGLAACGACAPLLDVGTGSGVLAIAAARLGFAPVVGLDHDRDSVGAAQLNVAANRVRVEVRRFDIRSRPLAPIAEEGDRASSTVVVANLLLPLLLELAQQMTFTPRHLLAGGLLREQATEVADAFAARHGMCVQSTLERGEWAAVWLAREE
jgi:ribosomal protein L11 methyltransferase